MANEEEVADESTMFYGSGNIFADIGLPNPEELLAKAKLASAIGQIMDARHLTQAKAAKLMGIDQPKVSKILRGRLTEFSTERLMTLLLHLGQDVEIVVHGKRASSTQREGTLTVAVV